MLRLTIALMLAPPSVLADSLVATRTIRAQTILTAQDVALIDEDFPGTLDDISRVVGQEARVTLYSGRPIREGDLGAPAMVDRNEIVTLAYQSGALDILTEGRALERGGAGDLIRVMNLASRNTVTGVIDETGLVRVASLEQGFE